MVSAKRKIILSVCLNLDLSLLNFVSESRGKYIYKKCQNFKFSEFFGGGGTSISVSIAALLSKKQPFGSKDEWVRLSTVLNEHFFTKNNIFFKKSSENLWKSWIQITKYCGLHQWKRFDFLRCLSQEYGLKLK